MTVPKKKVKTRSINAIPTITHPLLIQNLIDQINQKADSDKHPLLKDFARHYYQETPIAELQNFSSEMLYKLLYNHWELSYKRDPQTDNIRVYTPSDIHHEVGSESYSVIMITTDDMPFIVDSVHLLLTKRQLNTHFIIHRGGLLIERDGATGVIKGIYDDAKKIASEVKPYISSEAFLYILIDKQNTEEALRELQAACHQTLQEVRTIVTDWAPMRARMTDCLPSIDHAQKHLDKTDVEESKDFLKWLLNDHFIFLGCRDYRLNKDKNTLDRVKGSSLGILKNETHSRPSKSLNSLPPEARDLALSSQILVFTTTSTKARIHRAVYTEYIGVKQFDEAGHLIGERRFIGLYTSYVYQCDVRTIPVVRRKLDWILSHSKLLPTSHSGKALLDILFNLPRGELLQVNAENLLSLGLEMLGVQSKPRIRLFLRRDIYQRFMSCLVYVPREQLTPTLQSKIETILMKAFSGLEFSFEVILGESKLARLHFLIRTQSKKLPRYDIRKIEAKLIEVARSWQDNLKTTLLKHYGREIGIQYFKKYQNAFPVSYRETWHTDQALADIIHIEQLSLEQPVVRNLYQIHKKTDIQLRFQLFQLGKPITLSTALAVLEKMGLQVLDEWPTEIKPCGTQAIWIHNFGLHPLEPVKVAFKIIKPLFQEAFLQIWRGEVENDNFNRLVLLSGLSWREITILRAYTKYMHQIGTPFNQHYVESALVQNPDLTHQLVELFKQRFDPRKNRKPYQPAQHLEKNFQAALDKVKSLDEDRILNQLWNLIQATLRTNYFQRLPTDSSTHKPWLSFKLDSTKINDLPQPKPQYEIFVYSTQMEGIHLRTSKISRGGLRWSDRREDFRTEVLGLTKAQQVKNAVIVPGGAKGGFVCKSIQPAWDRTTVYQHVIACYKTFIKGLLDITDNIRNSRIISPSRTLCYDENDPYLVVAADKGTASFSDIANQIAADYGFWLGDAFASGGSQGYDHKKIGITARGVWESIKWHCHLLDLNPAQDDFTVVGIGDMSGDVFGNGMLLSPHIKLIAAFNHSHIFIDPNPNPEESFIERKRLFELERSNWSDYDCTKISQGGGVFDRQQKSIHITPEIQALLNIATDTITPPALIKKILTAPVNLLWNGGIGTYVKASNEHNSNVGDKNNDHVRVDATQLRCHMVGEGGNLGFTQLGRIEYALKGGLICTDFIDNSAGVDCSDKEVNCKILLNAALTARRISKQLRNQILVDMTDEIAELVLMDNYHQIRAISLATLNTIKEIELYRAYLNHLEREGHLNRSLEYLPDNQILTERKTLNQGLTNPEIAILLAYTKIQVKNALMKDLPDISKSSQLFYILKSTFPKTLREQYETYMPLHSLRREIVATKLSNDLVNQMGVIFIYRMSLETGAEITTIVQAWLITRQFFQLDSLLQAITTLSHQISLQTYAHIMRIINRLARRVIRWIINHPRNIFEEEIRSQKVEQFTRAIMQLQASLLGWLTDEQKARYHQLVNALIEAGVPQDIAYKVIIFEYEYGLMDIIQLALDTGSNLENTAQVWFMIGTQFEFNWLRVQIRKQIPEIHWDMLIRVALLDDLDTQQTLLAQAFIKGFDINQIPVSGSLSEHIAQWKIKHYYFNTRWERLLLELRSTTELKLAILSIALRTLTSLTQQIQP
jgi:glutamate dehydrogenase